jgi:tryptophan synthase beta subunit
MTSCISSTFAKGAALVADREGPTAIIFANLCGWGDKDIFSVAQHLGVEL